MTHDVTAEGPSVEVVFTQNEQHRPPARRQGRGPMSDVKILTTEETLVAYVMWASDRERQKYVGAYTVDELAAKFIAEWEKDPDHDVLAGRVAAHIAETFKKMAEGIAAAIEESKGKS